MNLLKRHTLLIGTRFCPVRRLKKAVALFLAVLIGMVVAVSAFHRTEAGLLRMYLEQRAETQRLVSYLNGELREVDKDTKELAVIKWEKMGVMK